MNTSDILNRLNDSIAYLKGKKIIKTQQDIVDKLGYNKSSVSQALNGKNGYLTKDFLKSFTDGFPEINYNWLLNGETEMFNEELIKPIQQKKETDNNYYYPGVNASAGLETEMQNDELKRIPINIPNWEKGVSFINVYGDSMYPKFCSGEIIGIKEVEPQYINYGYAYVVILNDGQVFLKYIKKGKDEEHWLLASENSKYESKEYHLSLIKKIFIIKGVITKTTM